MQRGSRELAIVAEDYDITDTSQFNEAGYPKMNFIEHRYAHDPTNWWLPNRSCVEAMLRSAGFTIEAHPEDEVYLCKMIQFAVPRDGPHCVYPARAGSIDA